MYRWGEGGFVLLNSTGSDAFLFVFFFLLFVGLVSKNVWNFFLFV